MVRYASLPVVIHLTALLTLLLPVAAVSADAEYCVLPDEITFSAPPALAPALGDFRELNAAIGITVKAAAKGKVPWLKLRLTDDGTPEHPQGWRMNVTDRGVVLAARTPEGLFNALQTLAVTIRSTPDRKLRIGQRQSAPGIPERAVAFSVRKLTAQQIPSLKRFIRTVGFLRYNRVFIEFGDNFPLAPELYPRTHSCFTPKIIGELTKLSGERFIRIVPLLSVWSDCPSLEGRSDRERMLEVQKPLFGLLPYCPHNPQLQALIQKTVAGHCELLHPEEYFFRIDRNELRHHFRQCPKCKAVPAEQLISEHLAFLAKCATDANARPGFLLLNFDGHSAVQLAAALPAGAAVCGLSTPERCADTADAGDMTVMQREVLRSHRAGERLFILRGDHYVLDGEMMTFHRTSPWLWRALVQTGAAMWSPERPEYPADPVAVFRRLLRLKAQPEITRRGIPIPLGTILNADLSAVDGFPRFNDPEKIARMRSELAAMPENFELAVGGGVHCYASLLAGEVRDNRFPAKLTVPLGDCKAQYIALLLTCSQALQQADFDPVCRGKLAFEFPGIAYVTFNYADGTSKTVNLRYMIDITDWNRDFSAYDAPYAVTGYDQHGRFFHFDRTLVKNPRPELALRSFTFGSHRRHWLAPALLAASLIDTDATALPPADVNAVIGRVSNTPPQRLSIPKIRLIDFESDTAKKLSVELSNAVKNGKRLAPQIDYPTDISAPSHDHVLRIVLPAAEPESVNKPIELRINLPSELHASMRSLGFSVRIDHPESLYEAFQILADNRNATYMQEFVPSRRWRNIWTAFVNPDLHSRTPLRDVYRSRMRRIVFRFHELPEPVTILVDDIGYSRWILHTRPEVLAK